MFKQRISSLRRFSAIALAACAISPFFVHAQEVTVMSIQAMTGPIAFAGAKFQNGIRLAIDEANQKNVLGGTKIKLIEADNQGDKGQAINLSNQAIDRDKALMVIGPSASSDGAAVSPIFNDKKVPLLAMATADAIIEPGIWSYKFQQSPADISPMVARYAYDKLGLRKVATIYDRSNPGLMDYKNFFIASFKAAGGSVVSEEAVIGADTNFLPLVTKLKSMDIDALYLSVYAEQGANIMLQLRQAGLPEKVRVFGSIGIATSRYVEVGGKAVEGSITTSEFIAGTDRPMNKAYEAAYKAKYNEASDGWAATGYSSAQVAIAAIKAAGPNPTREKVRDAMSKLRDVPVVVGSGLWNHADRRPKYGAIIMNIKDGKFVPVQ